jgi:formate hydrogenlyase subunit 6/NADH:ubiquinone oxidoreductase subunit I
MISSYWQNIKSAFTTSLSGLKTTFKHFVEARHVHKPVGISSPDYFSQDKGIMTLSYPHESLPIPDNGRYKLHNEIDDCIVCDKCAKVCPVDCIDIEPIRAISEIGKTSDGTSKRIHAAKFDIDMAKCCFCGLCTTVCPTECLTMTKSFDFSEYDVDDHTYSFATMTPLEILTKKKELEEFEATKKKTQVAADPAKAESKTESEPTDEQKKPAKPVFRPRPMIKKKKDGDA